MSDPKDTKAPDGSLDLDWDDALADLDKELDAAFDATSQSVKAVSAPMPQKPAPKPPPARALYRPPSVEEVQAMKSRDGRETAPPPTGPGKPVGASSFADDDDHDPDGRTMVGALSEEIRSGMSRRSDPPRSTARPPEDQGAPGESPARNSSADLDFDGLLDGLDSDTSMYPAEVPRMIRPATPAPQPPPVAPRAMAPTPALGVPPPPPSALGPPGAGRPTLPKPAVPPPRPVPPKPGAGVIPRPVVPAPAGKTGPSALAAAIAAKAAAKPPTPMGGLGRPAPFAGPPVRPAAPVAPPPAAPPSPAAPKSVAPTPAENDEFDDVLAELDKGSQPPVTAAAPASAAGASTESPATESPATESEVERAFFREPSRPPPPAASIVEELRDLADDGLPAHGVHERVTAEQPVPASPAPPEVGDVEIVASDDAEISISTSDDEGGDDGVIIMAGDDDEAALETTEAGEGSERESVDEEATRVGPPSKAPPPAAAQPGTDRGALAARQSVRSRKPRKEHFPLVGRTPAHRVARAELLETLAQRAKGASACRLLVSAAELRRGLGGEHEAAIDSLLQRAIEAAPTDPSAIRAARSRAIAKKSVPEVVELFAREAKGSSRLAALASLSLVELAKLSPKPWSPAELRAEDERLGAVNHAQTLLLPLHASATSTGADRERALVRSGLATVDGAMASALQLTAAASATQRGDVLAMLPLGTLLGDDGAFVRARARILAKSGEGDALLDIASCLGGSPPGLEAARRLATVGALATGRADEALRVSAGASAVSSLRMRARAAALAKDAEAEVEALAALAQKTGATERASAMARIAELRVERGELDQAEEVLRAAALADPELSALRVVRTALAQKDPERAARTVSAPEAGATLAAKAVYQSIADERRTLALAEREDDAPLTADVVGLDVAAGLNVSSTESADPLLLALRRHSERLAPEARRGALLGLAVEARAAGRDEEAEQSLEEARALSPSDPLVLEDLARGSPPSEAARALLDAAGGVSDPLRAAALALRGARILERAAEAGGLPEESQLESLQAARRGAELAPTSPVGWLTLSRAAKAASDPSALAEAEEQLAGLAAEDLGAAAHLVRAALARSGDDAAQAGELLQRARQKAPRDLVLFALSMRLGSGLPDAERAAVLEAALPEAPPALMPALRLAAAAAYEASGAAADAARILGPTDQPGDPPGAASARRRAFLRAGKPTEVRAVLLPRTARGEARSRVAAIEILAEFEEASGNLEAAAAANRAILELDPGRVAALRWLERSAMVAGKERDLKDSEIALANVLEDPNDAAAHLRLAARLTTGQAGDAADALILSSSGRARMDLWLARRVLAAATAAADVPRALDAAKELLGLSSRPEEKASMALRAAELAERVGLTAAERAALLTDAANGAPSHPVIHGQLARLLDTSGDVSSRIAAWQRAGEASLVPQTRASAFHHAGVLAEDEVGDEERALGLFELAADADVTYADVFSRAQRILERRGDLGRLNALLAKRLAAGGDATGLIELHLAQAKLHEKENNPTAARAALRAALELAPEHPAALKRLAELSLAALDYRSAADGLIRLARVRKDREELRWVFYQLGDIYDVHIPDQKRAEAAWKRVLKLAPDDLPSMERLAALYLREGPAASAIQQLEELIKAEPDPDRAREHHLSLARVLTGEGDARRAEQVLEAARRMAPTELKTLKAMADLYTRERAQPALAMHLNRAVSDFRHALETDLADTAAWLGLVEVLGWRGRRDAARVVASAAVGMGIVDIELGKLLDERGGAPGIRTALGDESVEDALTPAAVTGPLRAVFRTLGPSLEKVVPFDPRTLRAEKLGPKDTVIRPIVLETARALGLEGEVEVWLAAGAPRACLPVQSHPVVLVVGKDLLTVTDEAEKRFLVARALKIAKAKLCLAVRSTPADLAFLLAGLVLNADPNYQHDLDVAQVQEWGRRVARAVPRRLLEDNGPLLFEMAGAPEHQPATLPLAVAELGSRAALVAGGSVSVALSALFKMMVDTASPSDPSARAALLARVPEAAHLLWFAISDGHFEVRSRAGADRA